MLDDIPLNSKVDKSSAYTVVAADKGKVINATTGTWTLSLTAAATLGDGFVFGVLNSGAGVITVDPNASETIDGATTKAVAAGGFVMVYCDGGKFSSVGGALTASQLLSLLLTVDGSGSGLDADLLDGNESSAFVLTDNGALAVGTVMPVKNNSGTTWSSGATKAGSGLARMEMALDSNTTVWAFSNSTTSALSGTWRNISGFSVGTGAAGLAQRIS